MYLEVVVLHRFELCMKVMQVYVLTKKQLIVSINITDIS